MNRSPPGLGALTAFFAGWAFPAGCRLAAAFTACAAAVFFVPAALVRVLGFAAFLPPVFLVGVAISSPR
jgi:hypothetical protein